MNIDARMIINSLSIVIHYFLTKTPNLTFIGCHKVWLKSYRMPPSWHDDTRACALTIFVPYTLHEFRLTSSFLIGGYGIFLYLRCTIPYSRTMSACELCIHISSSFIYTLYPVLSPPVSNIDSIISPCVSMMDLVSSLFDPTLTKFPTRSLVEGGTIHSLSMFFHPIIKSPNFMNRAPCRAFVKNMQTCVLWCSMQFKFCWF